MELVRFLFALGLAYLMGSIPTGFLIVRWLKHTDIRTIGSKNVGATNTARAAGLGPAIWVFAIDVTKGFIAVALIGQWLIPSPNTSVQLWCGLAAVLGHDFPIFLRFSGGKGVATTIGVLLAAWPSVAAVALVVWFIFFLIWRYVSVASLAAAVIVPFTLALSTHSTIELVISILLATLMTVRHHGNIRRLLQGTEHKTFRW